MKRRIVITGIGVISPAGLNKAALWDNLLKCTSPVAPITHFDASKMPTTIAAEIKNFNARDYVDDKKATRYDPSLLFCMAAAKEAFKDAGLKINANVRDTRIGVVEGTTATGLHHLFEGHEAFISKGYKGIQASKLLTCYNGAGSSEIAIELGLKAQATSLSTSCSSGNDAAASGARYIESDLADVMLVGATDASIAQIHFSSFLQAGVMSRLNNLQRPMRPFDINRSGFVLGEGSCFLVLEELTHALGRNAPIIAEWMGHGQYSEAYHQTSTTPAGEGIRASIKQACLASGIQLTDIQYLNAHGSCTETNEIIETNAYKALFGAHAYKLQISAIKPVTGHMLAASSAVELAACALAIQNQVLPPTAHLYTPMPECDLDYIPLIPRAFPLEYALNVNMGFGGKVSAVVLKKFE